MVRRCVNRIKNFCKEPFIIGNLTMKENGQSATDGRISSTVLMACIIPIIFVIIIVSSVDPTMNSSPISWGIPEIMIIVGLICSLTLFVSAMKGRGRWISGTRERDLSQKPRLVFLWLFGLINILNGILDLSINIDCLLKDGKEPFPGEQLLSVFSHLMEIFFVASQLGFISYYVNFQFITSIMLNYGICMMLITHLVIWFHTVVYSLFRHHILKSRNFTILNETDCFWGSDINSLRRDIKPYISPAQTEYSLLSAAFLLKIWSIHYGHKDNTSSNLNSSHSEDRSSLLQHQEPPCHSRDNNSLSTNFSNGNIITDSLSFNHGSTETDEVQKEDFTIFGTNRFSMKTLKQNPISFYIVLLVGIFIIAPVLSGALIMITVRPRLIEMRYVWEIISSLFSTLHLMLLVVAFCLTRRQCVKIDKSKVLKGKRHILILSASGTIAYGTFELLSAMVNEGYTHQQKQISLLSIYDRTIDIIGVFIQTVLIIHSGQCIRKLQNNACLSVASFYLLLLITNLTSWCGYSFIYSNMKLFGTIHYDFTFYTEGQYWPVMHETLYPFVIFYRFHSAMDMYESYRKFRVRKLIS